MLHEKSVYKQDLVTNVHFLHSRVRMIKKIEYSNQYRLLAVIRKFVFIRYLYNFQMTKLSVNINKLATIRNARGGNLPDILKAAQDIQRFGAEGITVHPRPDERHIRYQDAIDLKALVTTEYNIEGYPSKEWMDLVLKVKPDQATLVPDPPDAITSNAGWDTVKHEGFLKEIITELKKNKIRTSIFIETNSKHIENAVKTGTDRIELYTESYAKDFSKNAGAYGLHQDQKRLGKEAAVKPFTASAILANKLGLGINAGHDLTLENLGYFQKNVPGLLEVSIGHALISDALYYGLENTVQLYLRQLK